MATPTKDISAAKDIKKAVVLPAPNGDFYQVTECLNEAERDILKQVRAFLEANVAPVITKYWAEDSFPFEVLPGLANLDIAGLGMKVTGAGVEALSSWGSS